MSEAQSVARRALAVIHAVEDAALSILLGTMILLAVAQIALRNLFDTGFLWADPMLRHLVLWVGLIGAMIATRQDKHVTVDLVARFTPPRARAAIRVLTDSFAMSVSGLVAYAGVMMVKNDIEFGTKGFLDIPSWMLELVIPLAFAVIALRYARYMVLHLIDAIKGVGEDAPEQAAGGAGSDV